jgi:anti-sigma B factor antagonist
MPDTQPLLAGRADATPRFECSCREGDLDAAWVHVAGDLDMATTPQLERTLRETQVQARLVVLDLRELAFMDCSGVHTIVNASIRARQIGGRLMLLRGRPNVDRVFALTGSSDDLEISDVAPAGPPVQALQRGLLSSSLLKTG